MFLSSKFNFLICFSIFLSIYSYRKVCQYQYMWCTQGRVSTSKSYCWGYYKRKLVYAHVFAALLLIRIVCPYFVCTTQIIIKVTKDGSILFRKESITFSTTDVFLFSLLQYIYIYSYNKFFMLLLLLFYPFHYMNNCILYI